MVYFVLFEREKEGLDPLPCRAEGRRGDQELLGVGGGKEGWLYLRAVSLPPSHEKKVSLTGIQMSFPFQCTPFCNLLCLGSWRVQESGLARNSFFCRLRSGGAFFWVVSTLSHGGGVLFCPLQFKRGTFFSFLTSPLLSLPWLLHLHLLSVLKGLLRKEPCGFRGRERRRENEGMRRRPLLHLAPFKEISRRRRGLEGGESCCLMLTLQISLHPEDLEVLLHPLLLSNRRTTAFKLNFAFHFFYSHRTIALR